MLLAVALALANACCFARCVAHFDQSDAPACHEHGKNSPDRCVQPHELNVALPAIHVAIGAAMPVQVSNSVGIAREHTLEISNPSPPYLPPRHPPQPLRL